MANDDMNIAVTPDKPAERKKTTRSVKYLQQFCCLINIVYEICSKTEQNRQF